MKGVGVTRACALGTVYLLAEDAAEPAPQAANAGDEEARLAEAVAAAGAQLNALIAVAAPEAAAILASQLHFLGEGAFGEGAVTRVRQGESACAAVQAGAAELCAVLAALDDPCLRERAADARDVGDRILRCLQGVSDPMPDMPPGAVVVARELSPSRMARLDRSRVVGFVTELGGGAGHTAILARSLGIAAVVGCAGALAEARHGDAIFVDGETGTVALRPDAEALRRYARRVHSQTERRSRAAYVQNVKLVRADGRRVYVSANVDSAEQAAEAKEAGADGIGLFRAEYLFMARNSPPTEDEQFDAYKFAAQTFGGAPVVIRTLDIGGDKRPPYLDMPAEENPFLGLRGVRLCLRRKGLFRAQLRALLRAAMFGDVRILFPMICSEAEWAAAKAELAAARAELAAAGVPFAAKVPLGMMIETPAAAILADKFALLADFFSIGANDLTQYTLAADRGSPHVANLYDATHPAVLALVKRTIAAARKARIPCGMCGDLAADPAALEALLGYGLNELSVPVPAVSETKSRLLARADIQAM